MPGTPRRARPITLAPPTSPTSLNVTADEQARTEAEPLISLALGGARPSRRGPVTAERPAPLGGRPFASGERVLDVSLA